MKTVLYIVKPDFVSSVIAKGYSDVLSHLGWKVLICNPPTKFHVEQLINNHNVELIFTSCKYGINQLPIKLINQKNIGVIIEVLPSNDYDLNIEGKYEVANLFEIECIEKINRSFLHTNITEELWPDYMQHWCQLNHIPYAGNIFEALSEDYRPQYDVCFVDDLPNEYEYAIPVLDRVEFLKFSTHTYGLSSDQSKFKNIYAKSVLCLNFHTKKQVKIQACINEKSFMIQLCGGIQLTDMPLASRYFGDHITTSKTITEFIHSMENIISGSHSHRFDNILRSVENASLNHTYFNRLSQIFDGLFMSNESSDCTREGFRLANFHIWEMEARLDNARKGKKHESFITQLV